MHHEQRGEGRRRPKVFSQLSELALLAVFFLFLKLGAFYWERSHLLPGPFPILGNLWQLSFQLHLETLLQVGTLCSSRRPEEMGRRTLCLSPGTLEGRKLG